MGAAAAVFQWGAWLSGSVASKGVAAAAVDTAAAARFRGRGTRLAAGAVSVLDEAVLAAGGVVLALRFLACSSPRMRSSPMHPLLKAMF